MVRADVRTGVHRSAGDQGLFTTAYCHHPDELGEELERAGFQFDAVLPAEGPAWLLGNVEEWLDDPERREHLLWAMREVEREPTLVGVSGHLLAIGHSPR